MLKRLIVAAVGIPAAFYLVYLGGWPLAAALAALAGVGAFEVYRLADGGGVRALVLLGILGAVAMPFGALMARPGGPLEPRWLPLLGGGWIIAIMLVALGTRSPQERPLAAVSITVFGAIYTGGLPSFLLWLRHSPIAPTPWAATWLVFLPLAATWICDTLAMLGGSVIGGPKLAPVVSPKKTWAGTVAGGVGAVLIAPVYGRFVLEPLGMSIPFLALLLIGLGVGILGQLGDLAKSLFKREANVKDSGGFFPGHGGVVDRFDSLYWVIPTTVLILRAFEAA
ncbi:MAG: phosphatidate cytidylyltransferase [Gemmatimonadetes bacterium]|nr:phosphatidate cytidylyltransferase [Gemmatimonadota bacterium]